MHILFICTGNTCRSPMAEALFQQMSGNIEVRSAGLYKFQDFPVSPHAIAILAEYGIQYHNKPQGVNLELLAWADLILTMTKFHKYILLARFPETIDKTFTLKEFVGEDNLDISDPVGKSLSKYRQCAQEINFSLNLLQQKLLHAGVENNFSSFPTPQPLPRIFPLLRWTIELTELIGLTQNERKTNPSRTRRTQRNKSLKEFLRKHS